MRGIGVEGLASVVRRAVKRRTGEGAAKRGIIQSGCVFDGSRTYPFTAAVDCHTEEGSLVWFQLTKSGKAVIVGA